MKLMGWLWGVFLLVITVWAYTPVFNAAYVNWDDIGHVLDQKFVAAGDISVPSTLFQKADTANKTYVPLTVFSFALERFFWGLDARVSHSINFLLHLWVVALVFFVGRRLGLSLMAAYVAALLFALHPMHVEAVAWVTARKDLLYSIFFLASLYFYLCFLEHGKAKHYIWTLLSAVFSILAKPMALSLPLILFLLDGFKRRKIDVKLFVEKIPFFMVIVPVAGITYLMNSRAVPAQFPQGLYIWLWSAAFYIKKFFWPSDLAAAYAIPVPIQLLSLSFLSSILIVILMAWVVWQRRRYSWAAFAVLFYVLSVFFLWRFDVYDFSIVADRFMYLPSLGFCFLWGVGVARFFDGGKKWRFVGMGLLLLLAFVLARMTHQQAAVWRNSWTLWSHVLAKRPDFYHAHYQRIQALNDPRFQDSVADDFRHFVFAHYAYVPKTKAQKAQLLSRMKYFSAIYAASVHGREIRSEWDRDNKFQSIPTDNVYNAAGAAFFQMGDFSKALAYSLKAERIGTPAPEKFINTGFCYFHLAQYEKSAESFSQALLFDPAHYMARLLRGAMYAQTGKLGLALLDAMHLVEKDAHNPEGYDLLFQVFIALGKSEEARRVLDRETHLWPYSEQVQNHGRILNDRALHSL
jgi:hypothetical protein